MANQTIFEENTKTRSKFKLPSMYHVVMYNDDFTPMDFVVDVLMDIFQKSEQDAFRIMMSVHKGGKAIVGTYIYDIAVTRADLAVTRARKAGYPFRVEAIPVDKGEEE